MYCSILKDCQVQCADVAQSVARRLGKAEVTGSSPAISLILSEYIRPKNIKISDRATLSNLLIGLNGFTIGTGIVNEELNGKNIISKPLISDEEIKIGIITRNNVRLSVYAETYKKYLKSLV